MLPAYPAPPPGSPNASDYCLIGPRRLRIDMAERVAKDAHGQRLAAIAAREAAQMTADPAKSAAGDQIAEDIVQPEPPKKPARVQMHARAAFDLDHAFATSLGLTPEERLTLLAHCSFRRRSAAAMADGEGEWLWRGVTSQDRPPRNRQRHRPHAHAQSAAASDQPLSDQHAAQSRRSPANPRRKEHPNQSRQPRPLTPHSLAPARANAFAVLATLFDKPLVDPASAAKSPPEAVPAPVSVPTEN